ncbi:MAG: hypothetical protein ACHQT7_01105 [Candidatus Levyibacteriota bacterium]
MPTNELIRHGVLVQGVPAQALHGALLQPYAEHHHNHVQDYLLERAQTRLLAHLSNPENVLPSEPGVMCGDGRYEEMDGKFARFGADGGYVLGLLALNHIRELMLPPSRIVEAVIAASGGRISIHSGEKAEATGELNIIDCAHLRNAGDPTLADAYRVRPEMVRRAVSYMKVKAKIHPEQVAMDVLKGEHREMGLIINESEHWKIRHGANGSQWFMWGAAHDDEHVDALYPALERELPELVDAGITKEDFVQILLHQTLVTAHELAHGKPIFRVNLDGPTHTIEPAGFIK